MIFTNYSPLVHRHFANNLGKDIICLATVGKDGLCPGIVLEKFSILGFYTMGNLGTQVRPFSLTGC